MTTIHIQLDDATYEKARRAAEMRGGDVASLAAELLARYEADDGHVAQTDRRGPQGRDVIGMWADDADVVARMTEDIMRWREERNLDMIEGPLRFDPDVD